MKQWPGLASFGRYVDLPSSRDRLFIYDSGKPYVGAPTVVLIHGLGDEADSWRSLFPLLAARARVVAPDLPGFGRSENNGRATLPRFVRSIGALLQTLGPSFLVGSSMGASVAELAAFENPKETLGLVLLDGGLPSAGKLPSAILGMLIPGIGERAYRSLRGRPDAAYRSLEPYYADLEALPAADREFLRERVVERVESETQLRAYFSALRSLVFVSLFRSSLFRRGLRKFAGPVLVGWGDADKIVPKETMEALAGARPGIHIVFFASAGHLPHQEKPGAVADAIAGLLEAR